MREAVRVAGTDTSIKYSLDVDGVTFDADGDTSQLIVSIYSFDPCRRPLARGDWKYETQVDWRSSSPTARRPGIRTGPRRSALPQPSGFRSSPLRHEIVVAARLAQRAEPSPLAQGEDDPAIAIVGVILYLLVLWAALFPPRQENRRGGLPEALQQTVNALSVGAIYALVALGYTMVYGIIELINFAHGDVFMIGAFPGSRLPRRDPRQ